MENLKILLALKKISKSKIRTIWTFENFPGKYFQILYRIDLFSSFSRRLGNEEKWTESLRNLKIVLSKHTGPRLLLILIMEVEANVKVCTIRCSSDGQPWCGVTTVLQLQINVIDSRSNTGYAIPGTLLPFLRLQIRINTNVHAFNLIRTIFDRAIFVHPSHASISRFLYKNLFFNTWNSILNAPQYK